MSISAFVLWLGSPPELLDARFGAFGGRRAPDDQREIPLSRIGRGAELRSLFRVASTCVEVTPPSDPNEAPLNMNHRGNKVNMSTGRAGYVGAAPWLGTGESDRGLSDWTAGWLGRFMPTRAREEWDGSGKEGIVLAPSLHAPSEGSVAKLMNEYAINECGDALVRLFRVARWSCTRATADRVKFSADSGCMSSESHLESLVYVSEQQTIHGRDNDHLGKEEVQVEGLSLGIRKEGGISYLGNVDTIDKAGKADERQGPVTLRLI
ncbi:hypothetical protein DFH09DRAFT_1097786 [Mycena vulgaris]|nr:hypothetical protein DFH09DRAFT_1097786 [Mycena vulgaris]